MRRSEYVQPQPSGVEVGLSVRIDLGGIAAWPADRSAALMDGIARVLSAGKVKEESVEAKP